MRSATGVRRRRRDVVGALLVALAAGSAGCAHFGFVDDGSTVSLGPANQGALLAAERMPERGEGHLVPPRWAARGNIYGTEELVTGVVRVGRRLEAEIGRTLGVADLSPREGGPTRWHRSHQTGLDVDLLFFVASRAGHPLPATSMPRFDALGRERGRPIDGYVSDGGTVLGARAGAKAGRVFDTAANWALVRALLEEPTFQVQFIFVYDPLRQRLLDHARRSGAPMALIEHAALVLRQPGEHAPHHDHFHVRIYCPDSDRSLGCEQRGPQRWHKKGFKYGVVAPPSPATATPAAVGRRVAGPVRALIASPLPFSWRP